MSLKKVLLTASALALLTGGAFADGGPVPEEPPAPPAEPAPPPEEPAPPPEEPAAPPPASLYYVALHGGAVWADDIVLNYSGLPFWFNVETDLDEIGWGAGGAIGRRYGSWRGELDVTWRQNEGTAFDSLTFDIYDTEIDSLSIMVNVVHDIDLGSALTPYLGAGIGTAHVSVDGIDFSEEDSWAFAYQFLAGISISISESTEFFVDYRYLTTSGLDLDFDGLFKENDDYQAQSAMGGLRFNF